MKKAQAAMEYLMTYGWAILIIIVVVAALYAMGVFKVGSSVSCSPCFSYFAYMDYSAGTLVMRNGANDIKSVTVNIGTISPSIATPGADLTITGIPTSGKQTIIVSYNVTSSGLPHTDTATINQ